MPKFSDPAHHAKGAAVAHSGRRVRAPFTHGAFAAGSFSVGFWDHWVPGATTR